MRTVIYVICGIAMFGLLVLSASLHDSNGPPPDVHHYELKASQ